MLKKIREFFRVMGELKYIIPLMRYKWPDLEDNASLAHSFQETVQKFGEKEFLYFEDEVWTYKQTNEAANILANGGQVVQASADHDAGEELMGLGGAIGLLRWNLE